MFRFSRPLSPALFGVAGLAVASVVLSLPHEQQPTTASVSIDGTRTLGAPKSFKNLTLIPIYDSAAKSTNTYMTLDEALKAKLVSVKEKKQGGEVNELLLTNKGSKPVYLMAGEVVLGGQQDRCVGQDTVVKPGAKNLSLTVFCVEHGRWAGRSDFSSTAMTVASADVRNEAQNAAFMKAKPAAMVARVASPVNVAPGTPATQVAQGGFRVNSVVSGHQDYSRGRNLNDRAQTATLAGVDAVSSGQSQIWNKVAAKNERFKTQNGTGTYRKLLQMEGDSARSGIQPYIKALSGSMGKDAKLVGVVAAVNGQIVAADTFNDPALFQKLWPKLLRSYASDAAENAPSSKAKPAPAVTAARARDFIVSAADSKSNAATRSVEGLVTRVESKAAVGYHLRDDFGIRSDKSAAGGRGGFGGGEAIHSNILKKP
jgi:hypothetical protein